MGFSNAEVTGDAAELFQCSDGGKNQRVREKERGSLRTMNTVNANRF